MIRAMTRAICLLVLVVAGGCARRAPVGDVSAADRAECRQRADVVFDKQNRAEVYRTDTFAGETRDAPFSTTGLPGITSSGLSGQYERANLLDDCLRARAGGIGAAGAAEGSTVPAPSAQPGPPVGGP